MEKVESKHGSTEAEYDELTGELFVLLVINHSPLRDFLRNMFTFWRIKHAFTDDEAFALAFEHGLK